MLAQMAQNLAMSAFMVGVTVTIHFLGLMVLIWLLRRNTDHIKRHTSSAAQGLLILALILGVFAIHTMEIWLYAVAFRMVDAVGDFETALYFSTVTFASLGYGDVTLTRAWRLFGAIEAANGVILFAWSTAFLLSIMSRLRALEHDWLER